MEATIVFDTGSNWLTVAAEDCINCMSTAYDPDNSTKSILVSSTPISESYGSADLMGYQYKDYICLEKYSVGAPCIDNFDFMAIESQTGLLSGIDGILGLGADKANGPLLLIAMQTSGLI